MRSSVPTYYKALGASLRRTPMGPLPFPSRARSARSLWTRSLIIVSTLMIGACSTLDQVAEVLPDKKVEYRKSRTGSALEMPPELASPRHSSDYDIPGIRGGTAVYSDYAQDENGPAAGESLVLPIKEGIRVERDGNKRWLVIDANADDLWDRTRDFWLQEGFLLQTADPTAGIMATDWSENRADIPSGLIRDTLKKFADFAYSAPTRDKYRTRFERVGSNPDVTEIYITHQGVREVISGESGSTVWQSRPSDPGLEATMLSRLAVFLGLEKERAKRMVAEASKARTSGVRMIRNAGGVSLAVKADFQRSWREVGLALDRVGFAVEDRDRSQGIYHVRYHDPLKEQGQEKGWLDKINFWSSDDKAFSQDPYQVKVATTVDGSNVTVLDGSGVRDNSDTAQRILTLLHEQLQ
jgi:outer membrane protein assembly factor BamC